MAAFYFIATNSLRQRNILQPAVEFKAIEKEKTEEQEQEQDLTNTMFNGPTQPVESLFTYNPEGFDTKIKLDLTPHEIELLRMSWKVMIQDEDGHGNPSQTSINSITATLFCVQFYSNLIAMTPELERMFPSIKHQAVSLSGVISTAIANLDHLEKMDEYFSNLGKRHSRILGIEPVHFELMGMAMLKTFKDRFGARFTLDLEKSWTKLFTYLSNQLLQMGIDPIMRLDINYHTITPRSNNMLSSPNTTPDNFSMNSRTSSFSSFDHSLDIHSDVRPSSNSRPPQPSSLSQMRQANTSSITSTKNNNNNNLTNTNNNNGFNTSGRSSPLNKLMGSNKAKKNSTMMSSDQLSLRSAGSVEEKCLVM